MNMKSIFIAVCFSSFLWMSATNAKTIATVNGTKITSEQVDALQTQVKERLGRELKRDQIVDSLIRAELMKQNAYAAGLDKDEKILSQVQDIKNKLIVEHYVNRLKDKVKISEKEYKKAYKAYLESIPSKQYKASHILVKKLSEAKAIIKTLNKKKTNFATLAKEKSIGPSGKTGGSLGWFDSKSMVKEFSQAVKKMKKGQHSKKPVKTKFGYHVILLEDIKENARPTLIEVKPQLHEHLVQPKILKEIEKMLKKAKIKRYK